MSARALPRAVALESDVDVRLAELWTQAWDPAYKLGAVIDGDDEARASFGAFLRAAYGLGYTHALTEDAEGRRSELHTTHGYRPV